MGKLFGRFAAGPLLVLTLGVLTGPSGSASPPVGPVTRGPASVARGGPVAAGPASVVRGGPVAAGPASVVRGGPAETASAGRGGPGAGTFFRWPLDGPPRPVRGFDPPPRPWLPGHRGVDLAAVPGAVVRTAGAGVVLFAGMVAGRPVLTVGHGDGLRTTYEPVTPGVSAGARLPAGAPIGVLLAGHPGCPVRACLHWGLRRGEDYLDPLALLGLGPVRLLPLDADRYRPVRLDHDRTAAGWAFGRARLHPAHLHWTRLHPARLPSAGPHRARLDPGGPAG